MVASSREQEGKPSIDVRVQVEGIALDDAELQELEGELRFLAAAKLYEQRKLSMGKAARLCGMNKIEFMDKLSAANISPLNWTVEELEAELARNR